MTVSDVCSVVEAFGAGPDGLAAKSRELVLQLLRYSAAPFSRHQFAPGHLTCTALVLHPSDAQVLFMYHHRLHRWLLPGGHIDAEDGSPAETAAREAWEETLVRIDGNYTARLVGVDVHGIPPKGQEPFHLHHDLIWCFRAASAEIDVTDEAPSVRWADEAEWDSLDIAPSIRNAIRRAISDL